MVSFTAWIAAAAVLDFAFAVCPDFADYSTEYHPPFSTGQYNLSYMRPDPACRTFNSSAVDDLVQNYSSVIKDPDLYRLFQNSCEYPHSASKTLLC